MWATVWATVATYYQVNALAEELIKDELAPGEHQDHEYPNKLARKH